MVKIFSNLPVLENVRVGAFFGSPKSPSSTEATREATALLDFVGLSKVSNSPAKGLTLANQKRLEVARALATKPELLLLDEMMAGLNQTEITQAMDLVKQIRGRGITIVMIEHVMKAIMNVCDRIIVLHHGKKIAEGTPQEIANSKTVVEVYLGVQTNAGS
jgi:branched-chain amino acid transport system ATP-binding protein